MLYTRQNHLAIAKSKNVGYEKKGIKNLRNYLPHRGAGCKYFFSAECGIYC